MKCIEAEIIFHDEPDKIIGPTLFAYEWDEEEQENFHIDQQIFYYLDYKEEIKDFLISRRQRQILSIGTDKQKKEVMSKRGSEFSVISWKDVGEQHKTQKEGEL